MASLIVILLPQKKSLQFENSNLKHFIAIFQMNNLNSKH